MTAFLISVTDILNEERAAIYGSGLMGVTERAGGRYVLRGWCTKALEGPNKAGSRIVVVAYDDPEGVQRYCNDLAILAAKPLKVGAVQLHQTIVGASSAPAPIAERTGAFLLIGATVFDVDGYTTYAMASTEAVHRHGGEYLVLGPISDRIDGAALEPGNHRIILMHFPSVGAALAYRDDTTYTRAREQLGSGAVLVVRLVET